MKFNIEIDCTPEEARRLFGLPDLEPLHEIYLSRVKELMAKGITPDMVQAMVKGWVPMGESGLGIVQSVLGQLGVGRRGGAATADEQESGDTVDRGPKGLTGNCRSRGSTDRTTHTPRRLRR